MSPRGPGTYDDSAKSLAAIASIGIYYFCVFEWDPAKAAVNERKHGVSFPEAATTFDDGCALDDADLLHSENEPRRVRVGRSANDRLVQVIYTLRGSAHVQKIRIISARPASRRERAFYAVGAVPPDRG
jgi:uncharacterized DUF497 family protein